MKEKHVTGIKKVTQSKFFLDFFFSLSPSSFSFYKTKMSEIDNSGK
jgi:hypothetical protein